MFSHEGALYWNMECSTLLDQDLYCNPGEDLFIDEQLTIKLDTTEVSPQPSGKEPTVQHTVNVYTNQIFKKSDEQSTC